MLIFYTLQRFLTLAGNFEDEEYKPMDWYIFLTPLLLLPIIFLFRLVGCTQDFDELEVGDGDGDPDRPPTYDFVGPSEGETGVASKDFTVSLQTAPASDLTVTPADDGDGGTFNPTSVVLNATSLSATFVYIPASVGAKTISTFNDGGLTDPAPLTYVSTAPLINITFKLIIVDPIPQIPPNPIIYIWPKFRLDDGGSGPSIQYVSNPILLNQTEPPFTFESVPTQVPAGNHTCSCDLFMLRLGIDGITPDNAQQIIDSINADPDQAVGQHLTGPAIVDQGFVADTEITFNLHYTQTPGTEDYLLDDFSLEQEPL